MDQREELERLLREHPFFRGMNPELRREIADCARSERYNAGEYIHREGEPADRFYLIRHGSVAQELHIPEQEPIIIQTLHEGDILGWSWLVPPYRWTANARVTQLTRVIALDARCLRGKYADDPQLAYELLKRFIPIIANRLEASRLQLVDIYGEPRHRK
jgi:CRP/FNR family cyclic AMP-dependent transcriptional regulator